MRARKADRRDELEREKMLILDGMSGQVAETSIGAIQSARVVLDGIADRYVVTRQEVLAWVRTYLDREARRRSRKDKRP